MDSWIADPASRRRAKIKLLAKKSIETGDECDAIPESMRQYLAIQAMESGKPFARSFLARPGGPMAAYGNHGLPFNPELSNSSKVGMYCPPRTRAGRLCSPRAVIHHFACRSLSIGSWRRVGQNAMDLVVFYSPDKACLTYYINNDSAGYKIEYPFANIKNITLENGDPSTGASGSPQRPGGLLIELNRPPNFFMDSSGSGGFYQCGDFTEDQQASRVMVHHLGGHSKVLSGQLAKLVSLESFQNRHNPFESNIMSASAPVSPINHRPASQPNHGSHPYLGMFQENPFGMSLHPGARGHKRTRSRSVPVAIDFSMLQSPMPSFHIQHPSTTISDPSIFAPIPHHSNNNFGPLGANLRIDTTSTYGLDFRPYPMSAATTASPSEYASPGYFTSAALVDPVPAGHFNTNYGLPFLSPMVDHSNGINPSVSPLSTVSHGDPVIADHSPQLSTMHRSASADFLSMTHDPHASLSDDGLMLSEMYSKQSLNLPMHSPHLEDAALGMHMHEEGSSEEMDMHGMVAFGTIDPSSLSPENVVM